MRSPWRLLAIGFGRQDRLQRGGEIQTSLRYLINVLRASLSSLICAGPNLHGLEEKPGKIESSRRAWVLDASAFTQRAAAPRSYSAMAASFYSQTLSHSLCLSLFLGA
ncbi:hypothetical protein KP509_34G021700 [Ceratopteris richardii]|uniref:Uncharacterized protein n=1 Tax=Ceratopteris richardii TaxID=49495 RepID=A0A8T2QJB5_CERRI|nr:hypothetical protein KP509_34G021700 [Ceratopteris richardii]